MNAVYYIEVKLSKLQTKGWHTVRGNLTWPEALRWRRAYKGFGYHARIVSYVKVIVSKG